MSGGPASLAGEGEVLSSDLEVLDSSDRMIEDVEQGDIARKSGRGAFAALSARLSNLFLTLLAQAILGRLLDPSQYGVYAMGMTALTFLLLFREFGLQAAGIQKKELSYREASFLFWANTCLALTLGTISIAVAPLVAAFYHTPMLVTVLIAMSIAAVIGDLSAQHTMLLRRQLRFTSIAFVDVTALACGIVAGLIVGFLRRDVWALLAMYLTQQTMTTVLTVGISRWVPGRFDLHRGHLAMLKFGAGVTAANILYFITNNVSAVLIGRTLGTVLLGHYNRAQQIYSIPATVLFSSVYLVVFASLSRLMPDPAEYRAFYLATLRRVSLFYMMLSGFLMIAGSDVIRTLLGDGWVVAGKILQIMAIGLVGSGAAQTTGMLYQTQGRLREFQIWGVIDMVLRVGAIVIASHWGIYGFALGFAVSTAIVTSPISMWYASRRGPVSFGDQVRAVRGSLLVFALAAGGAYVGKALLGQAVPALLALMAEGVACLIFVIGLGLLLPWTRTTLKDLFSDAVNLMPARRRAKPSGA